MISLNGFKTNQKCLLCSIALYRNPDVGGDFVKGILHSFCPECGTLYGPSSSPLILSQNNKKKVMVRVAMKFKLNFFDCEQIAKSNDSIRLDEFKNDIVIKLNSSFKINCKIEEIEPLLK